MQILTALETWTVAGPLTAEAKRCWTVDLVEDKITRAAVFPNILRAVRRNRNSKKLN